MEEEEEIVITDPFYASLNEESSLDDYWEVFKNDAIRSGRLDPGQNRTVSLFFGDEPDFASGITAEHAGRAFSVCNNEVISFEIIESFWEDYTIVQRLYTFYHEAGHARYNFRHPCEFGESCNIDTSDLPIMWRSIPLGNTTFEEFVEDKNNFFGKIGKVSVILTALLISRFLYNPPNRHKFTFLKRIHCIDQLKVLVVRKSCCRNGGCFDFLMVQEITALHSFKQRLFWGNPFAAVK